MSLLERFLIPVVTQDVRDTSSRDLFPLLKKRFYCSVPEVFLVTFFCPSDHIDKHVSIREGFPFDNIESLTKAVTISYSVQH